MSLTYGTALRVFTNPQNLAISICRASDEGRYSINVALARGEGQRTLLSTTPGFDTVGEAADYIGSLLEDCCQGATEALTEEQSPVAKILNPDLTTPVDALTLNEGHIVTIVERLKECSVVRTWELPGLQAAPMPAVPGPTT